MKERPGGTLIIDDGVSMVDNGEGHAYGPRLALYEGVLVVEDGEIIRLWSQEDQSAMQSAAQRVSERAWPLLVQHPDDPAKALAALVAAASKLDIYADFCDYFRKQVLLERAVAVVGPDRIEWRVPGPPPKLGPMLRVGLEIRISAKPPRLRAGRLDFGRVTAWLKDNKWEWSARALAGSVERLREHNPVRGTANVLGVFDVRNAGMIEGVGFVLRELRRRNNRTIGVSMHSAVTPVARQLEAASQVFPFSTFTRLSDFGRGLQRLPAVLTAVHEMGCSESDPMIRASAEHAFKRLHRGYVLQTLADSLAVHRMLHQLHPNVIVLASDAHRYARLIVAAAKSHGASTYVIQHGALVLQDFYIPVLADQMLAWGPWCRDWFVERGTPASQVRTVGFVRPHKRCDVQQATSRPTHLLFAAQPIADRLNYELLTLVRIALEEDQSLRLMIRPHPGEGRRASLEVMVHAWPNAVAERCSFSPVGQSLNSDLSAVNAVVMGQSTVGVDALSAGLPVFIIRHREIPEPIPYLDFRCVIAVREPQDLLDGLDALAGNGFRAQLSTAAAAFLSAYVGQVGRDAIGAAADAIGLSGDLLKASM